jgi:uncharacterized protein YggU (UPF0235/DUF167 family)
MESWIKNHSKGGVLLLHIQPDASKTELSGLHGEANEAVIELFSELLGIAKAKIFLIRGESSRQKDLLVELAAKELVILVKQLLK